MLNTSIRPPSKLSPLSLPRNTDKVNKNNNELVEAFRIITRKPSIEIVNG